jgi:DNA-binding IclR family transcriptional regulator
MDIRLILRDAGADVESWRREQVVTSVRAVERAVDILQAVAAAPEGVKVARLQADTGLARPTLYRIIQTLEGRGLLRQCEDPTKYALDIGVLGLARPWLRSIDSLAHVDSLLDDLAAAVQETVTLCLFRGATRVFVREIVSPHALKYTVGVGTTESVLRGASGHAILAFTDEATRRELLSTVSATERTRLEDSIRRVRDQGYAVSEGQILEGATAIAAPVFDRAGKVIGSVGIYGPTVRLAADTIPPTAATLLRFTRQISEQSTLGA